MHGLAHLGVTPNHVTIAACVLSAMAGGLIASTRDGRSLLLLPAVLLARMALNALDGMLAREHNKQTSLGTFLNELGDVVSDAALYLPLALIRGFRPQLIAVVVLLAALTEMAGMMGPTIGASRRYDGPFGKSDRAFAFGLLGLLLGIGAPIEPIIPFLLYCMILLLAVTVVKRARGALRESSLTGGAD
jgi:CDP-diacylglycerol--glycerol-3-phosphate 3-phosphatidyltransferase